MNTEMKRHVINLLETYPRREREIAVLRYEINHPPRLSHNEMIEAMSFTRGDGSGPVEGRISDRTLYIALNYREQMDRINAETTDRIATRLHGLEQEQNKLKYYISLLEQRQAAVIHLLYIGRHSKDETAKQLGLSARTIHGIKNTAIDVLTEMYELAFRTEV